MARWSKHRHSFTGTGQSDNTIHPGFVSTFTVLHRWYYLFFSSNIYSSTLYDISYAVSQSVTGPYTKAQAPNAPFLTTGSSGLTAPGGATVINSLGESLLSRSSLTHAYTLLYKTDTST